MEMVRKIQAASPICQTTEDLKQYGLDGVNCPLCNNRGYIPEVRDGILYAPECSCMKQRLYIRRIRNSGMADMMERYTFESYQTPDKERQRIKEEAVRFCHADSGWLYISGRPGSGKTHICVAICNELAKHSKSVLYMLWRDEAVSLKKALTGESDYYNKRMEELKNADVVYIDDFFKSGRITPADINVAFELINARYNNSKLRTIISSELSLKEVMETDEATGSRIWDRSIKLRTPDNNWRLHE